VREILDHDLRAHAVFLRDFLLERDEPLLAACDDDEIVPALRKQQREFATEARACAGDERQRPRALVRCGLLGFRLLGLHLLGLHVCRWMRRHDQNR